MLSEWNKGIVIFRKCDKIEENKKWFDYRTTEGTVSFMAEKRDYLIHEQEDGTIFISEDVIASIAALAVREVEGVYGLSISSNFDLANILGKKNLGQGIRVEFAEDGMIISCNLVVKMGSAVMNVAKNVQEAISEQVSSMTGERPVRVNVNVCGVATPKHPEK